jgi:hypothetical protein
MLMMRTPRAIPPGKTPTGNPAMMPETWVP